MRLISLLLIAGLTTTGCARLADSRLNPVNWFASGGGAIGAADPNAPLPALVPADRFTEAFDGRRLVAEVTSVSLDRTPEGGILSARGRAQSQGWFNAQLVLVSVEGRTATYAFRVDAPRTTVQTGTPASRQITAATSLTVAELAALSSIRVQGAGNTRSLRP